MTHEQQVKLVKDLVLSGWTWSQIAERLNKLGQVDSGGVRWTGHSVRRQFVAFVRTLDRCRNDSLKSRNTKKLREELRAIEEAGELECCSAARNFPKTREECPKKRPCPFVSCKYHTYLDVNPKTGSIKQNVACEVWEMRNSCSLDVAEMRGLSLEDVGSVLGLTRERVRQILNNIKDKLKKAGLEDCILDD